MLSRIEDAGLNASAPPQQRWMDGWLLRFSPGKARRARCINAVATGRLPLQQKLELAAQVYDAAVLPMVVRITRFSQPTDLDGRLADLGYTVADDTRVMVRASVGRRPFAELPPGTRWERLGAEDYAQAVGLLRGSAAEQRRAHGQRLSLSPVPYQGFAIRRQSDGEVLACGQFAREAELVGLYDVYTHVEARRQGFAAMLCGRLLSLAAAEGGQVGYLQVESDNHAAGRIYERLGFSDAYSYHYRQRP